jgi:hypothetical protein
MRQCRNGSNFNPDFRHGELCDAYRSPCRIILQKVLILDFFELVVLAPQIEVEAGYFDDVCKRTSAFLQYPTQALKREMRLRFHAVCRQKGFAKADDSRRVNHVANPYGLRVPPSLIKRHVRLRIYQSLFHLLMLSPWLFERYKE